MRHSVARAHEHAAPQARGGWVAKGRLLYRGGDSVGFLSMLVLLWACFMPCLVVR